ncbi:MAG: hypothetical protein ABR548_11855 [Actinomycetota bacterium]|nr:hypothetical protein [Actinomycetota bacterium]
MSKRMVGLAAAAVLALGFVPFSAHAQSPTHHTEVEVPGTGLAVGIQTPEGRTCAYVDVPGAGWYAVSLGGGLVPVNYTQGSGRYDPDSRDGNNFCDNNWEYDD